MNTDAWVVVGLILVAAALFASEKVRVDLVAVLVMAALLLLGIVSPTEGISGFSNEATVTVGAMFILSAGLQRTGAVAYVGQLLARVGKRSSWLALFLMMLSIGVISAFVNNTAAMAVFLPVTLGIARDTGTSPSRMLMPISFAAILGGSCTLIGTSTNILVSSIAARSGLPAFGMFELSKLGIYLFGIGMIYLFVIGSRLVPDRRPKDGLVSAFQMKRYLTSIALQPGAKSIGMRLCDSPLVKDLELEILELVRDGQSLPQPPKTIVLKDEDRLRVHGNIERLQALSEREGVKIGPTSTIDDDLTTDELFLAEVVIAPGSNLVGRALSQIGFNARYGASVIALRHHSALIQNNFMRTPLRAGDALLLQVRIDHLDLLRETDEFVIVSEVGTPPLRKKRILPALIILAGVIACAASGLAPIVVTAIVGSVLMIVSKCLTVEEAYEAIEWKVVFLLAGILSLGIALEKTGAAGHLSDLLIQGARTWGPVALLSALYLMTSILTEVMSNNATAALLAPIAIESSKILGIDSRPLLMAVTFAASASFMTPVGYQTNTLIYGPGQYKFTDYFRVGAPLNLLLWAVATLLIPKIWPFYP